MIATPPHTKKILVLYVMNGWMDGRWMTEIHEHSEFSRRPQRPQDDCILYTASVNPHSSSLCQPTKALATMTSRLYRDEDQPPLYTHTHTHTHTHTKWSIWTDFISLLGMAQAPLGKTRGTRETSPCFWLCLQFRFLATHKNNFKDILGGGRRETWSPGFQKN